MGWRLVSQKLKLEVTQTRTLGRADFAQDKRVSQEHLRLAPSDDGRLFVFDLNSANGTYINGLKLLPGVQGELRNGDVLTCGNTALKAVWMETTKQITTAPTEDDATDDGDSIFPMLAFAIYALLLLGTFSAPSVAFGKSIGGPLSLLLAVILFVAVVVVAFPLAAVMLRMPDSLSRNLIFSALLAGGTLVTQTVIYGALDDHWPITGYVIGHKVEYFCQRHFDQIQCIEQIKQCPACLAFIDRWAAEQKARAEHLFTPPIPAASSPLEEPRAPANSEIK